MNTKKAVIGLMAVFTLLLAPAVYAATEFGIQDELTVLGTSGNTAADPSVEIKGFTVFGATQTAFTNMASPVAGDVAINAHLLVSSGTYFVAGSTFAGYGIFNSTVTIANGNLKYGTADATNKVLKGDANGFATWGAVDSSAITITGEKWRVPMYNAANNNLVLSPFLGNSDTTGGTNITMLAKVP